MIQKVVLRDGVVRYRARVGTHGPLRTFHRLSDAEQYVDQQRQSGSRLRAGLPTDPGPITYDALCELFLQGYNAESKEWTQYILSHSRKQFGRRYVRELRPEQIGAWLSQLPKSDKTKKHILERMRLVLSMGVEWGYLERSPARPRAVRGYSGKRLEEIKPFESWAEVLKVAEQMPSAVDAALVKFGCATGLRTAELWAVRWRDVDGDSLIVHGTKTDSAPRQIPLSRPALDAIDALERDTARLFPVVRADYWRKSRWNPALKKAGLEHRPPYQMRHTFATLALSEGVPLDVVSQWLGHKSLEVTRRFYAKYTRSNTARWAELLDNMEEE